MAQQGQSITRGNFRFGYKQDPLDVSTNNIGLKTDSINDANQSKSHWSQRQKAVYQKTSSSSYRIPDSPHLDKIAKFQEFATLVQKYHTKGTAKVLLICANTLACKLIHLQEYYMIKEKQSMIKIIIVSFIF